MHSVYSTSCSMIVIQEGRIGLYKAIERYNLNMNSAALHLCHVMDTPVYYSCSCR